MKRGSERARYTSRIDIAAARIALFLALSFPVGVQGLAQTQAPTTGLQGHAIADAPPDEPPQRFTDTMRARRNEDRQKRLTSDTQRLLMLANQLKTEIASSGAETMTPEMLRQIDEIEHLARSVKDKMRN